MINGVLVLDKPKGVSSFKMVQWARRKLRVKKIGHTGTLDPIATGVLPLCVGKATKIVQFIMHGNKIYQGTMKLGATTETYDSEGTIQERKTIPNFTLSDIQNIANKLTGKQFQSPPPYSAVKHNGRPLYKLARQGIHIKKAPRPIEIFSFNILDTDGEEIDFLIHCTKGTYIRSIVHDFGLLLGCGAYLSSLRRIESGPFSIKQAMTPDQIEQIISQDGCHNILISVEQALSHIPYIKIDNNIAKVIRLGQPVETKLINQLIKDQKVTTTGLPFLRLLTPVNQRDSEAEDTNEMELVAVISWPSVSDNEKGHIKTMKVWSSP